MSNYKIDLKDKVRAAEKNLDEMDHHIKNMDVVCHENLVILNTISLGVVYLSYVDNLIKQNIQTDNLDWAVYELLDNERNKKYYNFMKKEFYAEGDSIEGNEKIFVVLEKKTGWISSNCQMLLLELFIERGISQFDYDNDTINLSRYLMYLDGYSKIIRNYF